MKNDRIELIKHRLESAKLCPPIAISSLYYMDDVGFLLEFIDGQVFDPVCRKCGDPLTTEELICEKCRRV